MGFQGSVESFSLADVFQNLAMNQQTGTLRLWVSESTRHIFFEEGQVKFLSHGHKKPLLLGEILLGRSIVTEEQVQEALEKQEEAQEPLGKCLVNLGYLDETELDNQVKHQIEEEIYELFGWERAQFEFEDGPPSEELFKDQIAAGGVVIPIAHLIMEAARRVDEWDQLKQQIPSFREIYVVSEMAKEGLDSGEIEVDVLEKRVLSLVDGSRDIEDLIQDSYLFRFEVLKSIASLIGANLIRPATTEELADAAQRVEQDGNFPRLCKVLERQLASGDDRPELRKKLAEVLAQEQQNEKAAIHFHVLAEAELQAGNEEEGVTLLKRILSIMPNHLPSRGQLGAIYAKRNQRMEAIIQYRELISAYKGTSQLAEARAACQRALDCDPGQLDIRDELIEIYQAEGDKMNAARQCEIKGDQLAKQSQVRPAAEAYRRAMQLAPSLSHLKKKLANVLLTQEDRRARTKRTVVTVSAVVVLVIAFAAMTLHEFKYYKKLQNTETRANEFVKQAQMAAEVQRFNEERDRYSDAISVYQRSGLLDAWTPIFRSQQTAQEQVEELRRQEDAADTMAMKQKEDGVGDAKLDYEKALKLLKDMDLFGAKESLEKVLSNPFLTEELRPRALKSKASTVKLIQEYEAGLERIRKPPKTAFKNIQFEYDFKVQFRHRFARVPQFSKERVWLPLQVDCDLNDVQVTLGGKVVGKTRRGSDNIFRYDPDNVVTFEFTKPGYQKHTLSTMGLRPVAKVSLNRHPYRTRDLEESLSGNACFDGNSVWVGTADGALLQLDPRTLKSKWRFSLPRGKTPLREIYGDIRFVKDGNSGVLTYVTKDGGIQGVVPGERKAKWRRSLRAKSILRAEPRFMSLAHSRSRTFIVLPVGHGLKAYDAATGVELGWGSKPYQAPKPITTSAVPMSRNSLIVFGCANGKLYAVDASNGTLRYTWSTTGSAIRGTPIVTDKHLIAASDDGKLNFFELKGGHTINPLEIHGQMSSPPVIHNGLLYVGTSVRDGLLGIDPSRQNIRFGFTREHIDGGVRHAPGFIGNRIYFGTKTGFLYAAEREGSRAFKVWKYKAKGIGGLSSRPLIVGNQVIFITANGKIYVFQE